MSALETFTPDQVTAIFTAGFTRQSERDKQVKIGPSEIGGCEYCVGHTMSQKSEHPAPSRGDEGFGYAAWIGTMCHYWLEQNLVLTHPVTGKPFDTLREHRVEVFDISDYGSISGSVDLYVEAFRRTQDYKFPGKYAYDMLKFNLRKGLLPKTEYRYQQQLYAHGLIRLGFPVEMCRIIFLPRHSNNVNDVVHWEEPYNPAMVDLALKRAEMIWDLVKAGELDQLVSDEACYTCDTYGR